MPFNAEPITTSIGRSNCPTGYVDYGGVCLLPQVEEIEEVIEASLYDFEYSEIGGEMLGRYAFGTVGDLDVNAIDYFGQGISVVKCKKFTYIANPPISLDDYVVYSSYSQFNDGITQTLTPPTSPSGDPVTEVKFGEFFILSNTAFSIYKTNVDVVITDSNNQEVSISIPEDMYEGNMVRWYMGIREVHSTEFPNELEADSLNEITPTLHNPVYGTYGLKWETLDDGCYTWMEIEDDYDPRVAIAEITTGSGRYIAQMKAVVDTGILSSIIASNVSWFAENGNNYTYNVVFFPPSIKIMQMDVPTRTHSPYLSSMGNFVNDIVIRAFPNIKTDGNIHYKIKFLTGVDTEDILFESTSLGSDPAFEAGRWQFSQDNKTWNSMSLSLPAFNNRFETLNGADSEQAYYVRYVLSDAAHTAVDDISTVHYVIEKIDGTLK